MSDEQRPDILMLGTRDYPALRIREEADPQHPGSFDEANAIDFEYFVYLTAFQETFNARWQEGERSYGRLNPMYYYGGTEREANISFTLSAMTVQESEQNLRKCSELSRAVYGRYKDWTLDTGSAAVGSAAVKDFTMIGHRYFRVDFGSLIRDERVFISGFTFTVNPDAGVFDYSPASAAESLRRITSGRRNEAVNDMQGQVLPRQIDIQISMVFRHDYPLGFGGPNRLGHPDKWAENRNRDFPHGTGEIPVQSYMSHTGGTTTTLRSAAQAQEDVDVAEQQAAFAAELEGTVYQRFDDHHQRINRDYADILQNAPIDPPEEDVTGGYYQLGSNYQRYVYETPED